MDELWVRADGPAAVVGWVRGDRAWRVLIVASSSCRAADLEPLLADSRPGAGAVDVVIGPTGLDLLGVRAQERWVAAAPERGPVSAGNPDFLTWTLCTAGSDADDPGTGPRPARFTTPALGSAVTTVLGPDRSTERPLMATLALDGGDATSGPVVTGFHDRWVWSNQRLREKLAAEVRAAAAAGRPVRPQPPLKGLGELVVTARGEAAAARLGAMAEAARLTQPVVVIETGVGNVMLAGALPEGAWRRLARGPQSPLLARVDVLVASSPADEGAAWPPFRPLAVATRLAAAVQVGVAGPPWIAPPTPAPCLLAEVVDGEVRLRR